MTSGQRAQIVELLESSRQDFLKALEGISEDAASINPGQDRWSILQIAEHVAIVENGLFTALENGRVSETSLENSIREKAITDGAINSITRYQSPERARPAGRFATLAQAAGQFSEFRQKTIGFARSHDGDLHFRSVTHPLFGIVSGYQQLIIMAAHVRRHAAQIAEIRAAGKE